MNAKLEFSLPEEQEEFKDACRGGEWHGNLQEVDNFLRDKIKYGQYTVDELRIYSEVRDFLRDTCGDLWAE